MVTFKKNYLNFLAMLVMFLVLFVFFSRVHPLVIYSSDDWGNISGMRYPWPMRGIWNPIKVLPEILMPMAGYVAAYFVMPFVGDYIASITYVSAFIVAGMITVTFYLLGQCTVKKTGLSEDKAWVFGSLSCMWAFFMFKTNTSTSNYLFWTVNLTHCYNYIVPALLNMSIVLYMMMQEDFLDTYEKMASGQKGVFVLACYLAIFSNIFHSVILAVYVGTQILFEFIGTLINDNETSLKEKLVKNIRKCYVYYGIVLLWLISLLFEASGGRAKDVGQKLGLFDRPYRKMLKDLLTSISLNKFFVIYVALIVIGVVLVCCKKRSIRFSSYLEWEKSLSSNFLCFALILIYLVLLGAQTTRGPIYMERTETQVSFWLFVLMILSLMAGLVIKELKFAQPLFPLLLFFALCHAADPRWHFKESVDANINPITCKAQNDHFIEQILAADRLGQKEMVLHIPKFGKTNWPHLPRFMPLVSRALYLHGIITRNIKVKVKIDPEMNKIIR